MTASTIKILGDEIKNPKNVPFTLNFAMKATKKQMSYEQIEEELAYNSKAQINNVSLGPKKNESTCLKRSGTTEGWLGKDPDDDTKTDD